MKKPVFFFYFILKILKNKKKIFKQKNQKDQKIYCPMSNKPLTMKDLFEVKFKLFEDKDNVNTALIARKERYVCSISDDFLNNSVPCTFLKTRYFYN